MKSIFKQIKQLIINHQDDIILLIGVILISLLSFAIGYIVAKEREKEPLKIESRIYTNLTTNWQRLTKYYESSHSPSFASRWQSKMG
jgi:archaellum biogenesis protein FlaJ (TadC family)